MLEPFIGRIDRYNRKYIIDTVSGLGVIPYRR